MKNFKITISAFCFLLSAFCFLPSALLAQKQKSKENNTLGKKKENQSVFFDVRFGPTIDWFAPTSEKIDREKVNGGFIAGVGVDVNLTPKRFLYFSTGVLFKYLQGDVAFTNQYPISLLDTSFTLPAVRTYQTMYLAIPTGITFRTHPVKNCVFIGKIGFYHNFKVGGTQFDSSALPKEEGGVDPEYFLTTPKVPNTNAALFAEAGYAGAGFEYVLGKRTRVYASLDYSCQFNYFSYTAKNNDQFKSIIHSLYITFGFVF